MKQQIWLAILGCLVAPALSSAQTPMERVAAADSRVQRDAASRGLAARVSVDFVGMPLKDALRAVGEQADLKMTLGEPVLALTNRVTAHAKQRNAEQVLRELLRGTDVVMTVTTDGHVLFSRPTAVRVANGTINGRVVSSKTNQPVAGATILVDDATKGVLTDADGNFTLKASAGEHAIHIRGIGFVRQTKPVTVTDDRTITLAIALEPSANILNEVVVTGTVVATERKAIPTPITVITAAELERRGITRIEQLFRGDVPGVLALEEGTRQYRADRGPGGLATSQVFARGSASLEGSPNPLKTYIDGVEMLDPSYLGTIDPKSIERIEIITGPQAATIYGSGAMGGVMQIFTKRGSGQAKRDITLSARYGMVQNSLNDALTSTHNDAIGLSGGTGPGLSYSANLSYSSMGPWIRDLWSRSYGASIGLTHTNGPLTASGSFSSTAGENGIQITSVVVGEMGNTGEFTYNANGARSSGQRAKNSSQLASLTLDYSMTPTWQHHMTVGKNFTDFSVSSDWPMYNGSQDSLYSVNSATGSRTTFSYNTTVPRIGMGWVKSTLTIGANGSFGSATQFSGKQGSRETTSITTSSVNKTLDSESWGGFGNLQIGLLERLYFTLGLRAERNPAYGSGIKFDLTPTNGLTYTFEFGDLSLKMLGSYGRATRPPTATFRLPVLTVVSGYDVNEYLSQFEASELGPERSVGPQGGLELYYGNLGSLTVNHYQQTVTDLIQRLPVDSFLRTQLSDGVQRYVLQYQYQNVAKVRQRGWEGTGSANVGPLSFKGTYSWNDSRVLSVNPRSSSAYSPGMAYRGLPTHTGSLTISYALGGTSVALTTNYVGAAPYSYDYGTLYGRITFYRLTTYADRYVYPRTDFTKLGYAKSDLNVSHRVAPWISATLNVSNLGNNFTTDREITTQPSRGRQTALGLSMRFPRTR